MKASSGQRRAQKRGIGAGEGLILAARLPTACMSRLLLLALLFAPVASAQIRVAGPAVPLTQAGEGFAHPHFSPDGRYVAFTSPSYDGLWVRDRTDGTTRQLTDEVAAGYGAAWSPDGTALVTRVARVENGLRSNAVRVFSVADGSSRLLTPYATRMPALPAWSDDGASVVLAGEEGVQRFETGIAPLSGKAGVSTLLARHDGLVRAADGALVVVPVEGQPILAAVPSPTGDRYAVQVMGAGLFLVSADGSSVTPLGRGEHPTWSPDGGYVAFMQVEDDGHDITGADLWTVRADGSAPSRLTSTADRHELFPVWTPDGAAIAFDDLQAGVVYLLPIAR